MDVNEIGGKLELTITKVRDIEAQMAGEVWNPFGLDLRSRMIQTLYLPFWNRLMKLFVIVAKNYGYVPKKNYYIASGGGRSYNPNVPNSRHMYGLAVDIHDPNDKTSREANGVIHQGEWRSPRYVVIEALGTTAISMGMRWGGTAGRNWLNMPNQSAKWGNDTEHIDWGLSTPKDCMTNTVGAALARRRS